MKSLISNFINGNLTDAKKQAAHYTGARIASVLYHDYGYTGARALATAAYLKGRGTFQAACDAA